MNTMRWHRLRVLDWREGWHSVCSSGLAVDATPSWKVLARNCSRLPMRDGR